MSISRTAFEILFSLNKGPSHGYAMIKFIQEYRGDKLFQPGLLYTTLPKLLDAGLIEETDQHPSDNDPRRRYYRLTTDGQKTFSKEAVQIVEQAKKISAAGYGVYQ